MVAKLKVGPPHLNSKGGLHGSTSATIVDWAGGMAIATHGLEHTGLSIDIHLSYISTAVEGDILTIEGTTTRIGQTLGFTTVNIFKGDDDKLTPVATGSHTKYILRDLRSRKS